MRVRVLDTLEREHKCATCMNGRVAILATGGRETVCDFSAEGRTIRGNVVECTGYQYRFKFAPSSIESMAWVLEKRGARIGFKPPKAYTSDAD